MPDPYHTNADLEQRVQELIKERALLKKEHQEMHQRIMDLTHSIDVLTRIINESKENEHETNSTN